ncbi:MAG: 5-methylcytosine restriction system specificity protein McrC [Flavobacteriales bacterium]|jgi:5-methylcytosine-specific restriction enzyme subunit McrC
MTIPVENIYYLLCYAWDKLEFADLVKVNHDDFDSIESLLATVLIDSTDKLLKRGLTHDYLEAEAEIAGIKGRINFDISERRLLRHQGKAHCRFDDFTPNILPNQIIKAILKRLSRVDSMKPELRKSLRNHIMRMESVDSIELQSAHFRRVSIHSGNALYLFLMNICELVFHNTGVHERGEQRYFRDFLRDEKKMAHLFENFIRNFYRRKQKTYTADSKHISWKFSPTSAGDIKLFPRMETDITLASIEKKRIIEVKYYAHALIQKQEGNMHFRSAHLYQLYAYLSNLSLDPSHPGNAHCSGILLYPTAGITIDEQYELANHSLRIYTLNLNQPWQQIQDDLLGLLER